MQLVLYLLHKLVSKSMELLHKLVSKSIKLLSSLAMLNNKATQAKL